MPLLFQRMGSWALPSSKSRCNLQTYNPVAALVCSLRFVAARKSGTCKIPFASMTWFSLHSVSVCITGTAFSLLVLKMVGGSWAPTCQVSQARSGPWAQGRSALCGFRRSPSAAFVRLKLFSSQRSLKGNPSSCFEHQTCKYIQLHS